MSQLPQEAREGLMRAWLAVLHARHPHVTWVPVGKEFRHLAPLRANQREEAED